MFIICIMVLYAGALVSLNYSFEAANETYLPSSKFALYIIANKSVEVNALNAFISAGVMAGILTPTFTIISSKVKKYLSKT